MNAVVSTGELKRAWTALEAGQFRTAGSSYAPGVVDWVPAEPLIVVEGVAGRVGASTTALAMAEALDLPVRVIECPVLGPSGLAAATTAELGTVGEGWRRGARGQVLIDRPTRSASVAQVHRAPPEADVEATLVDVGPDVAGAGSTDLGEGGGALGAVASCPKVLVSVATIPGICALERALAGTASADAVWAVVIGPPVRKWPKPLRAAVSPSVRHLIESGRLTVIRHDPHLAITGPTTNSLPARVLHDAALAIRPIFDSLKGP